MCARIEVRKSCYLKIEWFRLANALASERKLWFFVEFSEHPQTAHKSYLI